MTIQEIICELEREKSWFDGMPDHNMFGALNMAISALEKQIPKKPTSYKVEFGKKKAGYDIWTEYARVYSCPRCEKFLSERYDWCYMCGQALDWSDEK